MAGAAFDALMILIQGPAGLGMAEALHLGCSVAFIALCLTMAADARFVVLFFCFYGPFGLFLYLMTTAAFLYMMTIHALEIKLFHVFIVVECYHSIPIVFGLVHLFFRFRDAWVLDANEVCGIWSPNG